MLLYALLLYAVRAYALLLYALRAYTLLLYALRAYAAGHALPAPLTSHAAPARPARRGLPEPHTPPPPG